MVDLFGKEHFWKTGLSAHGVHETQEAIKNIIQKYRYTHNIFLASNGTKLQLIGAYLAARTHIELQLTYALPAVYNWQRYSRGCGLLWQWALEPVS